MNKFISDVKFALWVHEDAVTLIAKVIYVLTMYFVVFYVLAVVLSDLITNCGVVSTTAVNTTTHQFSCGLK